MGHRHRLCRAWALAVAGLLTGSGHADTLKTSVPHAILIDAASGSVLFAKAADELVKPAATVKLMTAELIFQRLKDGKLNLDQKLLVSETAWREGGARSGGSTMLASVNSKVAVSDLLRGLIIDSGNDAAIALAEGVAGSDGAFAVLMTRRARELGLMHLSFADSWGNSSRDQNVTAREMALLAEHIIASYPEYYKIFAERDFVWGKVKQPNRNPLLSMNIGADGLKTGNVSAKNGFALVGSAVENGERLIVAIFGAQKASERAAEARKILEWGFREFRPRKLYSAGDIVGSIGIFGGEDRRVQLEAPKEIRVLIPLEGKAKLTAKITYDGPLMAPVPAGHTAGTLKVYSGDDNILNVPLRTSKAVAVGSLPRRAFDAGFEYIRGLFRRHVLRS